MQISDITRAPETRKGLFLALFISLILKTAVLVFLADQPINNDGILYIAAAEKMAQGEVRQALALFNLPGFPLLVTAVHWLIPDWLTAGRLVSFLALLGALVPLYLTTRDLFGPKAAFFCGVAFAVAPYPNEFITYVYRGGIYFFLIAWSAYFAQRAVTEPKAGLFVAAALFAGVASLCRVEGALFIGVCTLFFCACLLPGNAGQRGAMFKGLAAWTAVFAAALAVALALLGPDAFSFKRLTGELQNFLQAQFLDHYHQLYQHLVVLGKESPYPSGNQNFAEIARHWIWFIYLVGLLEKLVVVMFPLFAVALLAGLRHRWTRASAFLIWVVAWYLLFVYYSHVSRDFIQTRFLFTPAFLFYPWVGLGLERIWARLRRTPWRRPLGTLFVIVFFVAPVVDTGMMCVKRDPVKAAAGRWIAAAPELADANKFISEARVAYHAGQGWEEFKHNFNLWRDARGSMQNFAAAHGFDVVVRQYRRGRKPGSWSDLDPFLLWKVFEGRKDIVEVYALPRIASPQGGLPGAGDRAVQ